MAVLDPKLNSRVLYTPDWGWTRGLQYVLRPPTPTEYEFPTEADERIDVQWINDLQYYSILLVFGRHSSLYPALFLSVENKLLDTMTFSFPWVLLPSSSHYHHHDRPRAWYL